MFNVKLDNFEGPLDLLLYFIKRDKIDIYDIPISKITKEYVDTINHAKKLNISVAGEFIFMASLLTRLKTRMLLPRREDEEGLDIDDPRVNLVDQLIQYKTFKKIANQLKIIQNNNKDLFYRPVDINSSDIKMNPNEFLREVSLFDISKIFKEALSNVPITDSFDIHREKISLTEQKIFIIANFDEKGNLSLDKLIKKLKSKLEIIVTFLALLEMIRTAELVCKQKDTFGQIEMKLSIGAEA
jgi:segregation and condensation protein A